MKARIGTVARCSAGHPGLITGTAKLAWGWTWVGIRLDTGGLWASRFPREMSRAQLKKLRADIAERELGGES